MHFLEQGVRYTELLGGLEELIFRHSCYAANLALHSAHVRHGLNNVARARLALGANHGSALGDAAKSLAQIACAAYERHSELRLVDVVHVIGGRQHLGFVDVVDVDCLKNLSLDEMADAALRHNRDAYSLLDALDHFRVAHARYSACCANVCGNALQSHNGACACFFGNVRLLGRGDVHDDAALEHLSEVAVEL